LVPLFLFVMTNALPLDLDRVLALLHTPEASVDLRYLSEVDSTNRVAAELPHRSWQHGTAILTDYQSAGRGRRGRVWVAPPCTAVLASTLLRPPSNVEPASFTMLAALAVSDAVSAATGCTSSIKWPNDVHIRGRKVAGILVELAGEGTYRRVILGTGINVNMESRDLPRSNQQASSLSLEAHREVEREAVASSLLDAIHLWYGVLTRAPDALFEGWKARLNMLGATLDIYEESTVWSGVALDVQRDGGLVVQPTSGSPLTLYAADLSVRPRFDVQAAESEVQ
jgi:BirA family biotin operon repressor/biotin-[acetyl-CoA-carboxylase] ligase